MAQTKTPIALFTYNRPEHTRRALAALERCERLDECDLIIFCDGAKEGDDASAVQASRQVVREWALSDRRARIVERTGNLGLAHSIVSGVTELCETYGRVIVLEDDLVVSLDFLDYMLQALDRYADNATVYQISGYMFPVRHPRRPDAIFLPHGTTWGWATWERAWRIFDWKADGALERLANSETKYRFDFNGSYPYSTMLQQRLEGKNESWGILFYWAMFSKGGLALHPRQSLVWQGGYDGTGVHCAAGDSYYQPLENVFLKRCLPRTIVWPLRVTADQKAFNQIISYLSAFSDMSSPRSSWRTKMAGLKKRLSAIMSSHLPKQE